MQDKTAENDMQEETTWTTGDTLLWQAEGNVQNSRHLWIAVMKYMLTLF